MEAAQGRFGEIGLASPRADASEGGTFDEFGGGASIMGQGEAPIDAEEG